MNNGFLTKCLVFGLILLLFAANNNIISKGINNGGIFDDNQAQLENQIKNFYYFDKNPTEDTYKNSLEGNDEGPHQNMIFDTKEWWYYNVYLNDENSELKNWFILMSIQLYRDYGAIKLELFDDENKSYGGDSFFPLDIMYAYGPGVNIFANASYEIGSYPNWQIYGEYIQKDNLKIIVNFTFKANSLPIWNIKNTGHNNSKSFFGYYCVLNCSVYGNVSLNGSVYNVSGLGYHDHTWAPMGLKNTAKKYMKNEWNNKFPNLLNIWDWLCIHFDNGWDMFVGKIYSEKRYLSSKFGPGSLCITTPDKEVYKSYFFLIEYEGLSNASIPEVKIPIKVHVRVWFFNYNGIKYFPKFTILDFYYEAKNIREQLYGNPPFHAYLASQGKVYGFAKSFGINIPLNGWAAMETTSTF